MLRNVRTKAEKWAIVLSTTVEYNTGVTHAWKPLQVRESSMAALWSRWTDLKTI